MAELTPEQAHVEVVNGQIAAVIAQLEQLSAHVDEQIVALSDRVYQLADELREADRALGYRIDDLETVFRQHAEHR